MRRTEISLLLILSIHGDFFKRFPSLDFNREIDPTTQEKDSLSEPRRIKVGPHGLEAVPATWCLPDRQAGVSAQAWLLPVSKACLRRSGFAQAGGVSRQAHTLGRLREVPQRIHPGPKAACAPGACRPAAGASSTRRGFLLRRVSRFFSLINSWNLRISLKDLKSATHQKDSNFL
jgi:hypothetical protein